MRYQVKVGQEFHCYVVEDHTTPVVFQVSQTQTINLPPTDVKDSSDSKSSWFRTKTLVVAALISSICLFPSLVYGWVTGDYSALKTLAESGLDLLQVSLRLIGKP